MKKFRTNFKHMVDQARLLIAETLIGWAVDIAPVGHPDSVAIYKAALYVMARKPAERKKDQ